MNDAEVAEKQDDAAKENEPDPGSACRDKSRGVNVVVFRGFSGVAGRDRRLSSSELNGSVAEEKKHKDRQ